MSIGEIGGVVFLGVLALTALGWLVAVLPGDTTRRGG
jgi:hypothetical protein